MECNNYYNGEFVQRYNLQTGRAEFICENREVEELITSVAMMVIEEGLFSRFKGWFLLNFTSSWIQVLDEAGKATKTIVNINSIARRIGLTLEEIETANTGGTLYQAMDTKLFEINPFTQQAEDLAVFQESLDHAFTELGIDKEDSVSINQFLTARKNGSLSDSEIGCLSDVLCSKALKLSGVLEAKKWAQEVIYEERDGIFTQDCKLNAQDAEALINKMNGTLEWLGVC